MHGKTQGKTTSHSWNGRLHLHVSTNIYILFEQPQQTLTYAVSLVAAAMSTTTVPVSEPLHLVAVNIYPHVVLQAQPTAHLQKVRK